MVADWDCYSLHPLPCREHTTDGLPCLLDGDVVGYGAGCDLGQDDVGVAEEDTTPRSGLRIRTFRVPLQ